MKKIARVRVYDNLFVNLYLTPGEILWKEHNKVWTKLTSTQYENPYFQTNFIESLRKLLTSRKRIPRPAKVQIVEYLLTQ